MALLSAAQVAKMKAREGKSAEAAAMLANALKARIANPASEQVEFLIDELVKTLVPRKKVKEIDVDAIDKQLVEMLNKAIADQENATTAARIYYARARLAQMLKRNDRSDLYLKGIATSNAKDPSASVPRCWRSPATFCSKTAIWKVRRPCTSALPTATRTRCSPMPDRSDWAIVALARKKPEDALKIFDDALENNPGMSRFKETTLGKLQALVELDKFEPAEKLALQIVTRQNLPR